MSRSDHYAVDITWRLHGKRLTKNATVQFLALSTSDLNQLHKQLGIVADRTGNYIEEVRSITKGDKATSSAILVFNHPLTISEAKRYLEEFGKVNAHTRGDWMLTNFKIVKVAPSAHPAVRAPVRGINDFACEQQTRGRYISDARQGPPYPANEMGCHGLFKRGNDDACYQSVADKNNKFTWRKRPAGECL